ncbi:MAG: S-layer homology domain-containing protein [Candidatus Gracilibacteria bacterium]|jgi:hypothetical protein
MFTVSEIDYYGNSMPEPLTVSGATTKNVSVSAATATGKATLPLVITFPSLASVSSLGFNDSIDIFAFNPSSRMPVIKTVSRTTLGSSPYSVDLFLPAAGDWNVGIGPAMPKGPMGGGMGTMGGWMPPQNVNVIVAATDIDGDDLSSVTLAMSVSDKTITGKVLDNAGTAVSNAEVYAYDPQAGKNANTTANVDGTFSLSVTGGSYKVGAFLPGLPSSQETPVLVSGSSFYVNGSTTASTGSSAGNPFNLKIVVPDYTIQGRVATSGGSAIAGAAIWAHRTDAPSPPLRAVTDSSGNYTLYVSAGTWKVEGDSPNYGYLGYKTLTVTTASLSSQNFEVASDLNTVAGTIDIPGTSDDSGTMVYAYGTNGSAEAKTDTSGNYTLNLPDGTYDIGAFIPGTGDLAPLEDVVVDGNETGQDITPATPRTFTVTLSATTTEDTTIGLFAANGKGNEVLIPAGSTSGTIILPEGTYYLDADVPGADFEDLTIVGAEFNVPNGDGADGSPVTTDQVNIDGTGDNMTITLPTMYTLTGQVTSGDSGVNDVFVSVYDQSTQGYFGTTTANNAAGGGLDGEYSIKVQAGTYTISADKSGYTAPPVDKTVAASSSGNNFALTASSKTITGTVAVGGVPIAGAPVWAEQSGGGFAATETSTDGTYTLNVDPGIWTVNAVAEGYSEGTALVVDATNSQSLKNFSVTALTGENVLQEPQTESITPSSGGTVIDEGTNVGVVVPPNALGTSTDSGQLSIGETNAITETPTASPVGNGYEIAATDSDGNPVTTLDDDVLISLPLTLSQLVAGGVDTPAEAAGIKNAYWDENAGNWASVPTDCIYYNASGVVIPENTVAGFSTLSAASVASIELISNVDHFTTFAPVLAVGATPPATPSGLAATAGDGSVALSWTKNSESDMSRYDIWEANVTEGVLTTLTQAACTVTPCTKTISSLTNGTAYSFQIIAVDTDGNSSAGSTAASATPVAATVQTPGGGVLLVGGSSGSSGSREQSSSDSVESADDLELIYISENSTNDAFDIDDEIGYIVDEISLIDSTETVAVTIPAETVITDSHGEVYKGTLTPPVSSESSVAAPSGATVVGSVYEISGVSGLNLSKAATLRLPLPSGTEVGDDLKVYYEEAGVWKLAGDGGEMMKDAENNLYMVVSINHFSKFAVMKFSDSVAIADGEDNTGEFVDIADHWAKTYIEDLYNKGIVSGYAGNYFRPTSNITRAEFVKMTVKMFGISIPDDVTKSPFEDVAVDKWYAPYIQVAKNRKLVTGYADDNFRPSQNISRAEALKILLVATGSATGEYENTFNDVDGSSWMAPYINYASINGLIDGYENGLFKPTQSVTRAEASKIISIMIDAGYTLSIVGTVLDISQ